MTESRRNQSNSATEKLSVMQLVAALRNLAQRHGRSGPPLDPITQICATLGHFDPMVTCQSALESLQTSQRLAHSAIASFTLPQLNAPARKFAA